MVAPSTSRIGTKPEPLRRPFSRSRTRAARPRRRAPWRCGLRFRMRSRPPRRSRGSAAGAARARGRCLHRRGCWPRWSVAGQSARYARPPVFVGLALGASGTGERDGVAGSARADSPRCRRRSAGVAPVEILGTQPIGNRVQVLLSSSRPPRTACSASTECGGTRNRPSRRPAGRSACGRGLLPASCSIALYRARARIIPRRPRPPAGRSRRRVQVQLHVMLAHQRIGPGVQGALRCADRMPASKAASAMSAVPIGTEQPWPSAARLLGSSDSGKFLELAPRAVWRSSRSSGPRRLFGARHDRSSNFLGWPPRPDRAPALALREQVVCRP